MIVFRLILITASALTLNAQQTLSKPTLPQTDAVPASCPFTPRPAREFIPPGDYHTGKLPQGFFYIGSERLWTLIREPMVWQWRPHGPGHELDLTEKIFWYRVGYSWRKEPIPKLRVTGRRLDGPAPALMTPQGPATNAIMDSERGAMLTGVYVPTPGCWEITGDYEREKLSFVVRVEPAKSAGQ